MDGRILELEGVHNFRDYGGYGARDGARLRSGILFRSGQHVDATPEDLDRIEKLNIATVIDLRGDSERASYPCARPEFFAAEVLTVPGETASHGLAPHIGAAKSVRTADEARLAMINLYRTMPFRPNLVEIFRLYFAALAGRDGVSLLHCLAGKDRTGLAVAILHRSLGVHPDDVMADYLLTNLAGNVDRRVAAGAQAVRAGFGHAMDESAVRTLMSVDPAFLETALAAIDAEYGSLEAYRRGGLGVDDAQLAAIEARLLV